MRARLGTMAMETAPLPSPTRRLWITVVVMAATLMQVLDSTIANVALPHMQATLGATQESVAWVLTSYIVAAAIATPITGWLEGRFGRRQLFAGAIIGFTISSAACGLAPSLGVMVFARLAQGIFGAFIGPLSQATLLDSYPPDKHAKALTIWGLGIMIGPIMGPVLGGWLTEQWNWRWVFFINVPIGIAATIGMLVFLRKTDAVRRRFDLFGFTMLALALASFQMLLDRGTQLDWFNSVEIIIEAAIAISALWVFIVHSATARNPLIPLALFRDRNFMIANLFMLVVMGIMMAGAALVTPMLQRMMGYGTIDAGLLVVPRGASMAVSMLLAGRLMTKLDPRILIAFGLSLVAWAQWMMTGFNLEMGAWPVISSGLVQGFGIGFVMLPMNLIAFATLAPYLRTDGASLYSLSRNIGGSIAISLMTSLIAYNVQVSHSDLATHVTTLDLPTFNVNLIIGAVTSMIDAEVNRQALMIAYLDDFWIMAWAVMLVVPLVIFMRVGKRGEAPPVIMGE